MNKIYAFAPLAGLVVFGSYYWKEARLHDARVQEITRLADIEKQEKRAKEDSARRLAHEQAALALAQRKQERAEKERQEEAQKQARIALEHRRNAAVEQARKLRPQIDRLRTDLEILTSAIARSEEHKRELHDERIFLTSYIKEAESNQNRFYQILEKWEAIERDRAAAPDNRPAGSQKT
jgi:hypothetical protein